MELRTSKRAAAIREAYERGYKVLDDGTLISPKGRSLSATNLSKEGYQRFSLVHHDKVRVQIPAHQLMAYQKYGELSLMKGIQTRHRNGITTDNSKDNITIGTPSMNLMDRPPEARRAHALRAASHLRVLTTEQAQSLVDDRAAGASYKELMAKYGVAKGTVSYIVNGKMYKELKRPEKEVKQ